MFILLYLELSLFPPCLNNLEMSLLSVSMQIVLYLQLHFKLYIFQIGLRFDSVIASIYDEAGLEIENVEILFTPEGTYKSFFLSISFPSNF